MEQAKVVKTVEIGECLICRVVISGISKKFMNVQGGVNLTSVGQEYQLHLQSVGVRGMIPDVIISETVKASFNRVLPAVQFKAVMPKGSIAGDSFLNMANYMAYTMCEPGIGEALVTIGERETKLYVS